MKNARTLLLLPLLLAATPALASNLNTTSTLADEGIEAAPAPATILGNIPVMPGLQSNVDKDLLRILPQSGAGRPVTLVGIVDVDDVYNFYKRELPPLGWKLSGGRDYTQGDKSLHINAVADGKKTTVTFTEKTYTP